MTFGTLARAAPGAYSPAMTAARLLRLLILLALALMPLRMTGIGAAMAMDHVRAAAATMDHCADRPAPADHGTPSRVDCMLACATLPATSLELAERASLTVPPEPGRLFFHPGIAPGADPPPPRIA